MEPFCPEHAGGQGLADGLISIEGSAQAEKWALEAKLCLHKQLQGDEVER